MLVVAVGSTAFNTCTGGAGNKPFGKRAWHFRTSLSLRTANKAGLELHEPDLCDEAPAVPKSIILTSTAVQLQRKSGTTMFGQVTIIVKFRQLVVRSSLAKSSTIHSQTVTRIHCFRSEAGTHTHDVPRFELGRMGYLIWPDQVIPLVLLGQV